MEGSNSFVKLTDDIAERFNQICVIMVEKDYLVFTKAYSEAFMVKSKQDG